MYWLFLQARFFNKEEIEDLSYQLEEAVEQNPLKFAKRPIKIIQLFSALPPEKQKLAFQRFPGERKIILATNIAETAITIDGIKFVIDSGFVKVKLFDARKGVESLAVLPISKASAIQRAGRAGRTDRGKCYRLYTKHAFEKLPDFNVPVYLQGNSQKRYYADHTEFEGQWNN
jgi:HrpA-like RNA helicase